MTGRTMKFDEWRGASKDERSYAEKPYSASSYCARYNVPLDDIELVIANLPTHGEVLKWIYDEYVHDPQFRDNAFETRPLEHEKAEVVRIHPEQENRDLVGPLTDPEFERPATIIGGVVSPEGMDNQRRFFAVEDLSDEELDGWANWLETLPGGGWLREHGDRTRRVYAMSCINLQREDPEKFNDLIVEGAMWNDYG